MITFTDEEYQATKRIKLGNACLRPPFDESLVQEKDIEALQRRIANPDLWCISRCFGRVTFMFYTDQQVQRHEADGMREVYSRKYLEILKPHDQFGYVAEDNSAE